MKKPNPSTQTVFNALRANAEALLGNASAIQGSAQTGNEMAILLNELEIYELELQMQNEELKVSYATLEMERAKFAGLFNTAPIGYFILKENGTISEINDAGAIMLQQERERIIGRPLSSFAPPNSLQEYYGFINRLQIDTAGNQCELKLVRKDGGNTFLQLNGIAVPDLLNGNRNYLITMTDVSNTKSTELQLLETTERLNQAMAASLTGTWKVKPDSNTISLDHYSKRILDMPIEQPDPELQTVANLFLEQDRAKLADLFACKTKDGDVDLELRRLDKGGLTRTILIKGKAIEPFDEPSYFVGILTDITERKRYEAIEDLQLREQRRLLRKAALDAEERERKKLGAALHDSVCQTLYGIRFGLNHIRKKNPQCDEELDNAVTLLEIAIAELRNISGELAPSVLKDLGVTAAIEEMVQRLKMVGFKVTTTLDQKADELPSETQLQIFRIVQELLNNSIKHSGAKGAKLVICAENGQLNIVVTDKGKGFSEQTEEALRKGSGLRSIKNRISLFDGTLEIANANGASLKVFLPKIKL